jgi:polysaccharide export outer membrane protein
MRWVLGLLLAAVCVLDIGSVGATPPRDGYRIGPNDVVRIQVFGEDDLTVEAKVSGDGKLNYPLLGMLQAEGRTIEDLQQELTVRLGSGYVRSPKVSVSIVRHRNFYVSGEVKTPGGYPYEEGLTVQKALSLAGGYTEKSDKQGVTVTRLAEGRVETRTLGPDDVIQPNDILMVATQNHQFYASGEVKNPGGYSYKQGLTVHRALAMAGGLTEKAERDNLRVLRHTSGKEDTLPVKLDTVVLPDDIIVVAEGQRVYVSGEVKTPGRYLYEKGMTVHKALSLAGGRSEKGEKGTIKVTRVVEGVAQTVALTPEAAVLPDDILVIEPQDYKFYTSGEVRTPGGYPYKEGLTVHRALAMAGGLTEKAERDNLRVLRHTDGKQESLPVQLDTPVLPDDIIVVAEGQRFYVSGEVKTPGRYLYERALTVHKALSLAGGRTERGEKGAIKVTRVVEGLAQTVPVNPDAPVLPDDILVIEPQDYKFYASGEVRTPGGYPYKEGLTVHRALAMAGGLTEKAERDNLRVLRHSAGHQESLPVQLDTPMLPDDIIVVAESQRFYISGEVKTPGRYLYEKGITAHKAIGMAGGLTEKAEKGTINVTRIVQGVAQTIEMNVDAVVLAEDFIVIPQTFKVYVNGEVKKAGDYPYEKGLTIHKAITMAGGFTDKAAKGRTRVLRTINGKEKTIDVELDSVIMPEDIVVVPRSFF